ncbi:hypothetical protein AMATHDRAFT_2145 [Amanita thiersii Skay4041]|uniref:RRM domain-containing protein n=1 Tax=Amanita thiersii Skay4041 TaxID=703135 RepID=A0A2A9NX76_9AGAR|nr:hypothetical protein AMATHDRAFT_2145 [Amanita thiersii Skay4041]
MNANTVANKAANTARSVWKAHRPIRQAQADASYLGNIRKKALEYGNRIELQNVPLSATTTDVRRLVEWTRLSGVEDVALQFEHFRPTGKALITLSRPELLRDNMRLLQNIGFAGVPLHVEPKLSSDVRELPGRTRGVKGREAAARRGILDGNGPHAGLLNGERTVTIWGFPGKTEVPTVEYILKSFKLTRSVNGKSSVFKIPIPQNEFAMSSRFIATTQTVSEAHRMVRQVNMTFFEPDTLGNRFLLRARIVH